MRLTRAVPSLAFVFVATQRVAVSPTHVLRKPTIAMVNGWCFGGAFTPLGGVRSRHRRRGCGVRTFRSELGHSPGFSGVAVTGGDDSRPRRYLLHNDGPDLHGCSGGRDAARERAVPSEKLRECTVELAKHVASINRTVLEGAKTGFKRARSMDWETSEEYLYAKLDQSIANDPEHGREQGMTQFLDDKTFRPGLGLYKRD